jgi:hypothetical protein
MLSIDRFRELLGPDCELNDDEIRELRWQIHSLAELVVDIASDTLSTGTMTQDTTRVDGQAEVN